MSPFQSIQHGSQIGPNTCIKHNSLPVDNSPLHLRQNPKSWALPKKTFSLIILHCLSKPMLTHQVQEILRSFSILWPWMSLSLKGQPLISQCYVHIFAQRELSWQLFLQSNYLFEWWILNMSYLPARSKSCMRPRIMSVVLIFVSTAPDNAWYKMLNGIF